MAGVTTLHQCVICDDIFTEYENLVTHNQTHIKTEESVVNTSCDCPTTNADTPFTKESFKEANLPFSSCPKTNDDPKISVSFDEYPKSFVETDAPFKRENDSADMNTHLTDDVQLLQNEYSRNIKNSVNASSDVGLENVLQASNDLNIDKFSNKTRNEFDKNSSDQYCKEEWLNVAVKLEQVDKGEPIRNHVGLLHSEVRGVCLQNRAIKNEKKDFFIQNCDSISEKKDLSIQNCDSISEKKDFFIQNCDSVSEKKNLFIQNCDSSSEKKDLSIQNCDSISEKKDLCIQNCVLKYNITNHSVQSPESNHDIKDDFVQRPVLDNHKKDYSLQNCVSNCKNTDYSLPDCAGVSRSDIDRKDYFIQHSETEEKRGKCKAVQIKQENREEFVPENQSKKCREYKAVYIKTEVYFQCKSCHKLFENGKDALKHHGVTQPNDFIKSVEFPQENTSVLPESLIIPQERTDGIAGRLTIPQKNGVGTADGVVISQKHFDRTPDPQENFHEIGDSLMKYEENVDENPDHLIKYEKIADGNPDILKENTAVPQDILRTRMKNADGIVNHCVQIQTVEMIFNQGNENSLRNDFNRSKNGGNKAFNQENSKRNKRSIADKPSFPCDQCGRNFTNLYHLKNHEKSHQREKRVFMCDMCGKHFQCVSAMETHRRTHTKEKPYPCTVCPKKFGTKGQLLSHTRTHTGEKPFNCEFCRKTFITSSNQQKHVRIHTGEKPYMCGTCDKTFSNSGDLRRHVRCHTGEKPYKCQVCQKDFAQKSNLRKHLKIHAGVKTHICHICQKAFIEQWNLTKHIRIHTRNQTRSEKQSSPSTESKSRVTLNIKKGKQGQ